MEEGEGLALTETPGKHPFQAVARIGTGAA